MAVEATRLTMAEGRAQFPVTEHHIYMDHAAVSPLPRPAAEAIRAFIDDRLANGLVNFAHWVTMRDAARAKFAQLFNCDVDEVAIVQNTAHGLSLVAAGFPWRAGDNVVSADVEYPSNVYAWQNLGRFGVECRLARGRDGQVDLDAVMAAADARTRLIAVSWVEFASGQRHDIARLSQFCRERGIRLAVDAIQAAGALALDVRAAGVDYLAAGAHKWLCGPLGTGVLYVRRELIDELWLAEVGALSMAPHEDFLDYRFDPAPGAARFHAGAMDMGNLAGLGAALDLLLAVGPDAIEAQVLHVTDRLIDGLQRLGYEVVSPLDPAQRSGIVAGRSRHRPPEVLLARCTAAGIRASVRPCGLRLSPHFYTTDEEVDRVLAALGPDT